MIDGQEPIPTPSDDRHPMDSAQQIDGELNKAMEAMHKIFDAPNPPTVPQLQSMIQEAAKEEDNLSEQTTVENTFQHLIVTTRLFDSKMAVTLPMTVDTFMEMMKDLEGKGVSQEKINKLTLRFARIYERSKEPSTS